MKKLFITLILTAFTIGAGVFAADLVIESKTQSYSETDNKIKFDGDVKVTIDEMKVVGDSADVAVTDKQELDTATFYDKPYAYEVKKNKKREVKANILKVSLITKVVRAEGDTQSIIFDGKTPIVVINADTQEYDTKTGVMTADGAVTIHYKDLETFSNTAKVKTDKNGDLKNIELIGNARIKEKSNESFADRFVYDSTTEVLTAHGNTTSKSTNDDGNTFTIKAKYQEYIKNKGIFNASGNVEVWYQDYYAKGPKVNVQPSPKTGKPNFVHMIGRSSITQGVRKITADKIDMTIDPKDFRAEGNTRTTIQNIGSGSNSDTDGDNGIGLGL